MRFHQIGSRSGWKHLEVRAVRDRPPAGAHATWRLLVVGHLDVEGERRSPPTRRHSVGPPDQEASKLQTSIAPVDHQVAAAARLSTRSGRRRRGCRRRSGRRASPAGRCASGTAPRTSAGRQPSTSRAKRIASCGRPALVGVAHEDEVVAAGSPRSADALRVLLRRQAADLELACRPARARGSSAISSAIGDARCRSSRRWRSPGARSR